MKRTPIRSSNDGKVLVGVLGLGSTEVDKFDVTSGIEEEIARLDIAMDDSLRVEVP